MRCQGVLSYVSDILLKINGGGAWGSYLEFTWHKWKRLYENEKDRRQSFNPFHDRAPWS